MSDRPRALFIAPAVPATAGNGLAMRLGLFLEALATEFDTELIVLPVAGAADAADSLPDRLGVPTRIVPVAGRADTQLVLLLRLADPEARLSAFRRYGGTTLAGQVSAGVLADVRQAVAGRSYDLVHIGRSYLARCRALFAEAGACSIDFDEDEAISLRQTAARAAEAGQTATAAWYEAEADATSNLIARTQAAFDLRFISSPIDQATLAARHPGMALELVDNGIEIVEPAPRASDGRTVLFVGSLSYAPNSDAVLWFARAIWPAVTGKARLLVVGRQPPPEIAALDGQDGIEVLTGVDVIAGAYARADLVVAPLRAGTGTRLKLLEAAAHGVPVVATSLAAQGLALTAPDHLWLADEAGDFAATVNEALNDPAEAARRARRARARVAERYDRAAIARRLACRLAGIAAR